MAHKRANVKVTAKECRGNHERMIRRFIKKVKKEKIIEKYKECRYYTKPSVKRKEKKLKAIRLRQREALKRLKAQERRNRKKR